MTRLLLVLTLLAAAVPARAQVLTEPAPSFPDPKKFARGFFVQGEAGALVFIGRAGRYARPGPVLGLRVGYDLWRFIALQLHFAGASNDANLPPPTIGQTFQTYLLDGEARLSLQLRRFQLFAQGGAGFVLLSANTLQSVHVAAGSYSFTVVAGGGLDYHTLNRHFSFGLDLDYLGMTQFTNAHALNLSGYLKYTH